MTETPRENTPPQQAKSPLAKGSLLVVPLILICSLALSGYMALGYTLLHEDTAVAESEADQAETNTGSNDEESPSGTDSDIVVDTADDVVVGEFRAASGSTEEGRIENIRLAAEAIDGKVIEPGATFSFNEAVGDIAHDERYELAPVVSGNEMVYGRGGGSCQVSSALYLAALDADMTIVERHPHSTVVDYTPIGLDATVVYGSMDLIIKNESDAPYTLMAIPEGQTVTVKLMGQPLEEGLDIELVSSLIEYHEAGTPVPNALEWDPVLENTTYYVVDSYREYYYNGAKKDSVLLARDIYKVLADSTVRMPDGALDITK